MKQIRKPDGRRTLRLSSATELLEMRKGAQYQLVTTVGAVRIAHNKYNDHAPTSNSAVVGTQRRWFDKLHATALVIVRRYYENGTWDVTPLD